MPTISKTKFLNGIQCHKLLWYAFNRREDFPPTDASTMAVFEQGHLVGEYARKLYPDGIDVAKGITDYAGVLQASREAAKLRKPMFEAGFQHGNALARADILVPAAEDKWDLIEVKSTSKVKKHYWHDLALQKYVYDGAGISIRKCFLMHLNNSYVRWGEVDPKELFKLKEITQEVAALEKEIAPLLQTMSTVIGLPSSPEIKIGPHCSKPVDCPLTSMCWAFLPGHNVTELYRAGKQQYKLIERGILRLADMPDDVRLTSSQRIQVDTVRSGSPYTDKGAIQRFLNSLRYPIYFLDFETFSTAIPLIDNARPYQQIPFQFSLHRINSLEDKPVQHSYLADGPADPRPAVLNHLRELLESEGTIMTFNATFEKQVLKEMSRDFPEYRGWFEEIKPRIVDLIIPFRSFAYYHPDQNGAASMKKVLPALTGKSYAGLTIADGGTASREYMRVTFGQVDPVDRENVRRDLETYCGLDTEGMIDILHSLHQAASQ